MPITNTDLMVIQQAGTPYKVAASVLKTYFQDGVTLSAATAAKLGGIKVGTNLSVTADGTLSANITGALVYKGVKDLTATPTGLTPAVGDLYVSNKAGTVDAGFTGLGGTTVAAGEMIIWDGAKWDVVGVGAASGTLTAVTADAPITVTNTNPAQPHLSVSNATPSTGGAGGTAGLLTAVDKEKLDGIASGAATGTVTAVTASLPIHVATGTTTPALTIDNATATAVGVVQLADAAAVTAGTAGRVVDAAQLKVVSDAVTTAAAGGVTSVVGTAPISVTGTTTRTVTIADASTTAKGAVQFATNAEVVTGTNTTKAVNPAAIKAAYLPKDISTLTNLP